MRNGRTPDPLGTVADALSEGGKNRDEICGPKHRDGVGICWGNVQGGGPKNGAKNACWKGGFPRVSPSNCPNMRSWKIPYPARMEVLPRLNGSHAIPIRGSKSCQSLLYRGGSPLASPAIENVKGPGPLGSTKSVESRLFTSKRTPLNA